MLLKTVSSVAQNEPKCPPKSVVEIVPNMHSLFSLNLLLSPEKGQNMLFQLEKVGSKLGLKAIWREISFYIYTHINSVFVCRRKF